MRGGGDTPAADEAEAARELRALGGGGGGAMRHEPHMCCERHLQPRRSSCPQQTNTGCEGGGYKQRAEAEGARERS
jgi:hypothetical protein